MFQRELLCMSLSLVGDLQRLYTHCIGEPAFSQWLETDWPGTKGFCRRIHRPWGFCGSANLFGHSFTDTFWCTLIPHWSTRALRPPLLQSCHNFTPMPQSMDLYGVWKRFHPPSSPSLTHLIFWPRAVRDIFTLDTNIWLQWGKDWMTERYRNWWPRRRKKRQPCSRNTKKNSPTTR